ncbi:MAG TPA: hypothetical protein VE844_16620, partial [Gammaproteobacteria bacterium]|nr:hypothetical protein [Gammaproteobacteria bacterium]
LVREGFVRMGQSPPTFLGIEVALLQCDVEAYFSGIRPVPPLIQLAGFWNYEDRGTTVCRSS